MLASLACVCKNITGNAVLISEQKDTLQNITLLVDTACHMQRSSILNEKPEVDIEVDRRIFSFNLCILEMYLYLNMLKKNVLLIDCGADNSNKRIICRKWDW